MSQLSGILAQAASRDHDLLTTLAQTDYAPPALEQKTAYIEDVDSQIQFIDSELTELHALTENERKDHVSYHNSKVKCFVYNVGGQKGKDKFSSKEQKKEREFRDAWQREREAAAHREELTRALRLAESDRLRLEQETRRHDEAQSELDQMYAYIFSGPTPEVPNEDQQETALDQARDYFSQMQHASGMEQQALAALQIAEKCMSSASQGMDRALRCSSCDVRGGGMMADMEERDCLSLAQTCVTQADYHIRDARRLQTGIRELGGVQFPHSHWISDIMSDNIFTHMAQHDRITECDQQVKRALYELGTQVREQQQRFMGAKFQSAQASESLEAARKDLQRIRAEAFEKLAGNTNGAWG